MTNLNFKFSRALKAAAKKQVATGEQSIIFWKHNPPPAHRLWTLQQEVSDMAVWELHLLLLSTQRGNGCESNSAFLKLATWHKQQCPGVSHKCQRSSPFSPGLRKYELLSQLSRKRGLPRWLSGKESAYQCRRHGFDPLVRKVSWRRNGNPLQYSWFGNPVDTGAWRATVHGAAKSQTQPT